MKILKPKFWSEKISLFSIILFPFSAILIFYILLKKKFLKVKRFEIPIICVGNIYLGGTGKTPTSILLATELSKLGKNPVILRKYYKNHNDEYSLIKKKFKNLILSKNRTDGIREAEISNFDSIILDDGLQDYGIKKNLNIVCFNSSQLIGNGMVLPAGPLRENLAALKNTQIVIINGAKNEKFEKKILGINDKLDIFYSYYKPLNIKQFTNKKILAIAGIGNPENYFKLLNEYHLDIQKKLVFPDHYEFSKQEIYNILKQAEEENLKILMTEKDYYKVNQYNFDNINYLQVSLEIHNQKKLIDRLITLYD